MRNGTNQDDEDNDNYFKPRPVYTYGETSGLLLLVLVMLLAIALCRCSSSQSALYNIKVGECLVIKPDIVQSPYVYRVLGTRGDRLIYIEQRRLIDTPRLGWHSRRPIERMLLDHVYQSHECPEGT